MKQLVKRAMAGDRDAFAQLIEWNTQSMYKIARAYFSNDADIADALGETVLICFEKIATLKDPRYFKTWLVRILINQCNGMVRRKRREICMEELPDVMEECSQYELTEFKELMDNLEEKYRLILILYYVEEFKISEISEMLDMKESTVKTRLRRGKNSLKKEYERINNGLKGVRI
ncbi:MAG: sigma-70 family RNA polymerase sigma factor [Lachnospiraceae bacterium]